MGEFSLLGLLVLPFSLLLVAIGFSIPPCGYFMSPRPDKRIVSLVLWTPEICASSSYFRILLVPSSRELYASLSYLAVSRGFETCPRVPLVLSSRELYASLSYLAVSRGFPCGLSGLLAP